MKYLLDTDRVASALKGRTDAQNLLSSLLPDGLAISLITYGEIYEGIYYGTDAGQHEQSFLAFLRAVDILAPNEEIMKQFATIRGALRGAGNIIGDFDLIIASTALHHGLTLVTRNTRHFERVPGLLLYQSARRS